MIESVGLAYEVFLHEPGSEVTNLLTHFGYGALK